MSARIFLGGSELLGWTDMQLTRSKSELSGSLSLSVFFGYVPQKPVATSAAAGAECLVYLDNNLAFTGQVDSRTGSGIKHGREGSKIEQSQPMAHTTNIGPDEYTIKIEVRGKTKKLVDSSHRHKTTNMLKPKTREVTEELLRDSKVALKWIAKDIELDKVRFRDGAIIADELNRVSSENAYYMFETRFGELCVTDDTLRVSGEALVLGQNILTFSATQDEAVGKEQIKVKGQRSKKNIRGEASLIKTFKTVLDGNTVSKIPLIVQHYGDATDEALERRGKFEIDKRNAASKEITIEVFGVSQSDGKPWDVGMLHYVEIPPEGIFDQFECTGVSVTIASDKTYKTTLTLSPPPSGGSGASLLSGGAVNYSSFGEGRRAELSVSSVAGLYPASWKSADVSFISVVEPVVSLVTELIKLDDELPNETLPPEKQ